MARKTKAAPALSRREENAEATRRALIDAAAQAFEADGFQATSLDAIARAARVTRGACYHHFADKRALFDAVVVKLQADAAATISRRAREVDAVCDRLQRGIDTFLDVSLEPRYRRIVIQDAPTVLGPLRFQEIEQTYPMALLVATLDAMKRRGELDYDDIGFLAQMIDAIVCKLAIVLPTTQDSPFLRQRGLSLLHDLLALYRLPRSRA